MGPSQLIILILAGLLVWIAALATGTPMVRSRGVLTIGAFIALLIVYAWRHFVGA